jgi:hypothetical protein
VRVEAGIVRRASGITGVVARTRQLAVWRTNSIEVALLAELLEAVIWKLLVCVDRWVRLCRQIVKLANLVR